MLEMELTLERLSMLEAVRAARRALEGEGRDTAHLLFPAALDLLRDDRTKYEGASAAHSSGRLDPVLEDAIGALQSLEHLFARFGLELPENNGPCL